jgi:hypothetical protein
MTVRELRAFLTQFPDNMDVIETRYSGLGPMSFDSWEEIRAVEMVSGPDGWHERVWPDAAIAQHPGLQLPDDQMARAKTYLHYNGN